mmetsp:Transcript_52455/g.87588  ORF Transcript_52455/g.87588 Transcript_52455/m.87588 type:complete len:424 (-) Transcript_52455:88-1359(-)
MVCWSDPQHVLVEGPREVAIQVRVMEQRHPHDTPHEFEVVQVHGVDAGQAVGLIRHALGGRDEEGVVGVKHLLGEHQEPLASQPPGVHPLLPFEHDAQAALQFLRLPAVQVEEGVLEHIGPPHVDAAAVAVPLTLLLPPDLLPEPQPLVLEIHVAGVLHQQSKGRPQQRNVAGHQHVQQPAVLLDELHRHGAVLAARYRAGRLSGSRWAPGFVVCLGRLRLLGLGGGVSGLGVRKGWGVVGQVGMDGMEHEEGLHKGQHDGRERHAAGRLGVLERLQLGVHAQQVAVDGVPQGIQRGGLAPRRHCRLFAVGGDSGIGLDQAVQEDAQLVVRGLRRPALTAERHGLGVRRRGTPDGHLVHLVVFALLQVVHHGGRHALGGLQQVGEERGLSVGGAEAADAPHDVHGVVPGGLRAILPFQYLDQP